MNTGVASFQGSQLEGVYYNHASIVTNGTRSQHQLGTRSQVPVPSSTCDPTSTWDHLCDKFLDYKELQLMICKDITRSFQSRHHAERLGSYLSAIGLVKKLANFYLGKLQKKKKKKKIIMTDLGFNSLK